MKKAVIEAGSTQHLVIEGQTLEIDLVDTADGPLKFKPLMIINGEETTVGEPYLDKHEVTAEVVEQVVKGEKIVAIRYKAKKRVNKRRGHRQKHTLIKVTKIT